MKDSLRIQVNRDNKFPYDPLTHGFAHIAFYGAVLGKLLNLTKSDLIEPGLLQAAYWDFERNAYILRLQPNLQFHNGRHVTSKDLEYSLLRFFFSSGRADPAAFLKNIDGVENLKPGVKFKNGMVNGIKILDDLTLSVSLAKPNPSFLFLLGDSWISVVPQEELNDDHISWKSHPVGAGPYRVLSAQTDFIRLQAVSKGTELQFLDFSSQKGDSQLDLAAYSYINPDPKRLTPIVLEETLGMSGLFFNFSNPIAQDKELRRAISGLINRNEILGSEKSLTPLYELLTSNFSGRMSLDTIPTSWISKETLKKLKDRYVNTKIRFAIKRENIDLSAQEMLVVDKVTSILSNLGFNVTHVESKSLTFDDSEQNVTLKFDHRGTAFLDPLFIFNAYVGRGILKNYMVQNDAEYMGLLENASKAIATDVKHQSIFQLSKYMFENSIVVPLYERKKVLYVNESKIKSVGKQPGIGLDYSKIILMRKSNK